MSTKCFTLLITRSLGQNYLKNTFVFYLKIEKQDKMLQHSIMLSIMLVTKEDVKLLLVIHIFYQQTWIII